MCMNPRLAIALLTLVLGSPAVVAQSYPGDVIVAGSWWSTSDTVARVARPGYTLSTILGAQSATASAINQEVVQAEDNADFYVLGSQTGSVYRVDRQGNLIATVATGFTSPSDMIMNHDGRLLVADSSALHAIDPALQTRTTLATIAGIAALTQNIDDGRLVLAQGSGIYSYDPLTRSTTSLAGLPPGAGFRFNLEQDHATGFFYAGSCCGTGSGNVMLRFDPYLNSSTIVVGVHPAARAAYGHRFDRRVNTPGNALILSSISGFAIGGSISGLYTIDEQGNVTSLTSYGTPATGVLTTYGMEIEGSRNLCSELVAAPNARRIRISFPLNGGKPYVIAASFSGPRPATPLGDGRQINLVPDTLTQLTLAGPLPPLWNPGPGVLDPFGNAQATLNLNSLGAAVRGLPMWFSVIVVDPGAPKGVAAIAETHVIVMN